MRTVTRVIGAVLLTLVVGCSADNSLRDEMSARLDATYLISVQRAAGEPYYFSQSSGRTVASNVAHGLEAELDDGALRVKPGAEALRWMLELRWTGLGRGEDIRPVGDTLEGAAVDGNRAGYLRHDGSEDWYLNGPVGIEQGFTLATRPSGAGAEVIIELAVGGGFVPQPSLDGASVLLRSGQGEVALRYGKLFAYDAEGTAIAAWMDVHGMAIRLVVDDTEASYPLTVDPLIWVERQKLLAGDGAANDRFGQYVALSGNTALVGVRRDNDLGAESGSAHVFVRNGSLWTPQQKLLPSDGAAGDWFGNAHALEGDTALVGTHKHDHNGADSGAAYVFVRSGATWVEQQELLPNDGAAGDAFGIRVSLSGDTALVGSWYAAESGTDSGSAYVFVRSGSAWTQQQELVPSDGAAGDEFGRWVSLSGDTALVGAWKDGDNGSESGSAYVFVRNGSSWTEQQKLTASDGAAGDRFGFSVSVDGDTALVGAHDDDDNGTDSGSAYVFVRHGGVWTEQQKLLASDGQDEDMLAWSVSLSGDSALVSALGDDGFGSNSGAAYVFVRSGGLWTEYQRLTASDGEAGDNLGRSVSIEGSTAMLGAANDDDNGTNSGAAYVFTLTGPCSSDSECPSGICLDGTCCDAPCEGGAIVVDGPCVCNHVGAAGDARLGWLLLGALGLVWVRRRRTWAGDEMRRRTTRRTSLTTANRTSL